MLARDTETVCMQFWGFLSLAFKRLKSRIGLTAIFVLGVALNIGVLVCVPVFVDAISLQILQEEIARKSDTQDCPPFPVRYQAMPKYGQAMTLEEADYDRQWIGDTLARTLRLPVRSSYVQNDSPVFYLTAREDDARYKNPLLSPVQVTLVRDVAEHIAILEGAPFGSDANPASLNVWIERPLAESLAMQVGEVFRLTNPQDRGASPIPVRIAGVWEAVQAKDRLFWPEHPSRLLEKRLLTTEEQYRAFIYPARAEKTYAHIWYYVMDDRQMSFAHAERYIKGLLEVEREVIARIPNGRMDFSPLAELEQGLKRKASLAAILLNFSLPLLGILFYFVASASAMGARFQRQEIAMLSSRGSSRSQILGLKLLETAIILVLGLPIGVGVGLWLARLMGYAQGFLVFAPREPIAVRPEALDWRLVGAGLVLSALAQVVPNWFATRLSIVTYEQWNARRPAVLSGMRLLLIGLLVVATYYAYRRLAALGSLSLIGWQLGDPTHDPLLLLAPSLFLFAAPLIASELFVILIRPVSLVARSLPDVSTYLGCMMLGREGEQYRTPVFLIVLCLSLGIFFASLGKSADVWLVDRRTYEVGADLVFTLEADAGGLGSAPTSLLGHNMLLLPTSDYETIAGVVKAARVAEFMAGIADKRLPEFRLLAADRLDWAQVIYFRPDFSRYAFGELLNRLGARDDALLVPTRLAQELQIIEGDRLVLNLRLDREVMHTLKFTVSGSYDWFPTMYEKQAYVVVANLHYLQTEMGGALPYGIWMRVEPGADTERILRDVMHLGVTPVLKGDLWRKVAYDRARLERVGMYGMLSICFLAGAALAGLGLLIYSLAAIMSQRVRYAVWQALGMRHREVIGAVSVEYMLTLLYGLLAGAGGGLAASRLYVPLFRLTDAVGQPIPPFLPLINWQDAIWLVVAMGATIVLIEVALLWRVSRGRVFEALRMGNRE